MDMDGRPFGEATTQQAAHALGILAPRF
ncbi:MAG: hypothetical protein RIT19_888, partial [Verrucomicrobiota bacterium]